MPAAIAVLGTISFATYAKIALSVASVLYSRQQARKQKKALKRLTDISAEAQERKLTALDPVAPRVSVYGEVEVGGGIVFRHVNGTNNEYRHIVIIMADHEVASFTNLKLNGELIPIDGAGQATGRFAGFLEAHFFLGSPSQTSNAALMANCPEVWTSDHRLRGMAGVYIRTRYNPALFPNSEPNFTALCRGKKLFDPRTALTVWSNNAALVLLDYMTDTKLGMGLDRASRFNEEELIASANNCDELVELADETFEKRYASNGTVTTDTVFQDPLDDMLEAMAGEQIDPGGIISIISGYYRTPTTTFTVDDLRAGYSVRAKVPRAENFNGVRGLYISPQDGWQAKPFPAVTNSTYETQDGGVQILKDLQFMFVTSGTQAQRLAKITLEKNRQPMAVTWPGKLKCFRSQVADVVGLTISETGWTDKPFKVINVDTDIGAESGILPDFALRETASTVYDWSDGEETVVDAAPNTNLPSPFDIAAPTDLVVQADNDTRIEILSGTFITRIEVTWTAPLDEFVQRGGVIEMEWKLFGTDVWIPSIPVRGDVTTMYIENPIEAQSYVVRIRSKNRLGITSAWVYSDPTTATGDSTPPDEPEDFTAVGGIGGVFLEWENPADSDFDHIDFYEHTATTPAPSGGTVATFSTDTPDDTTYFRSGLPAGAVRYYWQRAVDTSGNKSDWVGPVGATVAAELTVVAVPDYEYGTGPNTNVASGSVTAYPYGGVPTFAYLWEQTGGDDGINPNSPTSAITDFIKDFGKGPTDFGTESASGTFRCKVTDSAGTVAYSQEVSIELVWDRPDPFPEG